MELTSEIFHLSCMLSERGTQFDEGGTGKGLSANCAREMRRSRKSRKRLGILDMIADDLSEWVVGMRKREGNGQEGRP